MAHTTVLKPPHGSLTWLRLRHRTASGHPVVSASEAAAVHDAHRFTSKYKLATEKLADEPTMTETNEAMDRGNRLEPVLLDWVSDKIGEEVKSPELMYCYSEPGVELIATLDGVTGHPANPDRIVEIKTFNRPFDPETMPAYWYWQGVQQALCADVDTVIWGVFDSSLSLHIYEQHVTQAERAEHIFAVWEFTQRIAEGTIPDDWARTFTDLKDIPADPSKIVDITDLDAQVKELIEVQAELRRCREREDQLRTLIGARLGSATVGTINDQPAITWKESIRAGFDTKRFQTDHPDIAAEYSTHTSYRVMRTKK
jgi:predicted phage-related endonuclease